MRESIVGNTMEQGDVEDAIYEVYHYILDPIINYFPEGVSEEEIDDFLEQNKYKQEFRLIENQMKKWAIKLLGHIKIEFNN